MPYAKSPLWPGVKDDYEKMRQIRAEPDLKLPPDFVQLTQSAAVANSYASSAQEQHYPTNKSVRYDIVYKLFPFQKIARRYQEVK